MKYQINQNLITEPEQLAVLKKEYTRGESVEYTLNFRGNEKFEDIIKLPVLTFNLRLTVDQADDMISEIINYTIQNNYYQTILASIYSSYSKNGKIDELKSLSYLKFKQENNSIIIDVISKRDTEMSEEEKEFFMNSFISELKEKTKNFFNSPNSNTLLSPETTEEDLSQAKEDNNQTKEKISKPIEPSYDINALQSLASLIDETNTDETDNSREEVQNNEQIKETTNDPNSNRSTLHDSKESTYAGNEQKVEELTNLIQSALGALEQLNVETRALKRQTNAVSDNESILSDNEPDTVNETVNNTESTDVPKETSQNISSLRPKDEMDKPKMVYSTNDPDNHVAAESEKETVSENNISGTISETNIGSEDTKNVVIPNENETASDDTTEPEVSINTLDEEENIFSDEDDEGFYDDISHTKRNFIKRDSSKILKDKNHLIHAIYSPHKKVPVEQINAKKNNHVPFLNAIDDYTPEFDISVLEAPDEGYVVPTPPRPQTDATYNVIDNSFAKVIKYLTTVERSSFSRAIRDNDQKSHDSFMQLAKVFINKHCRLTERDTEVLMDMLEKAIFSYYILTDAIMDDNITDIRITSPNNINVKVKGKHYTAKNLKFLDWADYNRFIMSILIRNAMPINSYNPLPFTDTTFNPKYILRFNISYPTTNQSGSYYLHIRKVPKEKTTLTDLINAGMLDQKLAKFLLEQIVSSSGIIFAGPSASGKTTLMNALIDYIPKTASISCAQESDELFSYIHPNAYFQHIIKDNYGNVITGLSELGTNNLLCDTGYMIIGEIKGAEARDMLRASQTGHKCWCSVHSDSAEGAISRLADYVKYGADYSFSEAERMLKDLQTIVYIKNFKIEEIVAIRGYDDKNKRMLFKTLYKRNYVPRDKK